MTSYKKVELPFYAKLALILVCLISLGYIFVLGKQILSPLLYSFLFAILLFPLAVTFEIKFKLPRSISSGLCVILLVLFISLILYFVGSQIASLGDDWPMFKKAYVASLDDFRHWVTHTFHVNAVKQLNYVNSATSELVSSSTSIIGETVLSLSSILLFLVFVMIDTFFLLFYRRLSGAQGFNAKRTLSIRFPLRISIRQRPIRMAERCGNQ